METLLELIESLVSFESVAGKSDQLEECARFVEDYFKKTDLQVTRLESNGIPSLAISFDENKHQKIWLNSHLDVVPAKSEQFHPRREGGKLFGRGTCDTKSAAGTFIYVMKELAESGKRYPVGLMLVFDEEVGGVNGTQYLFQREGYSADFVLVGEPTALAMGYQSKGVLRVRLKAEGKPGHAAYPWNGINAIDSLLSDYGRIKDRFPTPKEEVWKTTINGSIIHGGTTINQVPFEAIIDLDIRFIPDDTVEEIVKTMESVCQHTTVHVLEQWPSFSVPESHPQLQLLAESIEQVTGQKAELLREHGTTDLRHLMPKNIAGVACGPHGKDLHGDNEWVDVRSVKEYYRVVKLFIENL